MNRMTLCTALLLLTPVWPAAQEQVPAPPKPEFVIIRSAGGTLELKGITSAASLEFSLQCDPKRGSPAPAASLTLPLEIEGDANGSLEQTTALLREAVAGGYLVSVEPSKESEARAPQAIFTWSRRFNFEGVLDSLSVKYTLFMPDGTPVRATATVKITEAGKASIKKGGAKQDDTAESKKGCTPSQQ